MARPGGGGGRGELGHPVVPPRPAAGGGGPAPRQPDREGQALRRRPGRAARCRQRPPGHGRRHQRRARRRRGIPAAADAWVAQNVSRYVGRGGVDIR